MKKADQKLKNVDRKGTIVLQVGEGEEKKKLLITKDIPMTLLVTVTLCYISVLLGSIFPFCYSGHCLRKVGHNRKK